MFKFHISKYIKKRKREKIKFKFKKKEKYLVYLQLIVLKMEDFSNNSEILFSQKFDSANTYIKVNYLKNIFVSNIF